MLPDTNRKCVHCGGKLYRWLVFNDQKLISTQPWKHWGTGSEYCDTRKGTPDDAA
jgi:hypothetical protein